MKYVVEVNGFEMVTLHSKLEYAVNDLLHMGFARIGDNHFIKGTDRARVVKA